jgi:hypothetical protein
MEPAERKAYIDSLNELQKVLLDGIAYVQVEHGKPQDVEYPFRMDFKQDTQYIFEHILTLPEFVAYSLALAGFVALYKVDLVAPKGKSVPNGAPRLRERAIYRMKGHKVVVQFVFLNVKDSPELATKNLEYQKAGFTTLKIPEKPKES